MKTKSVTESGLSWIKSLPQEKRNKLLASLTLEELQVLKYDWRFWARPEQIAPADDDWRVWFLKAGRGFGKTRTGAEWLIEEIKSGRLILPFIVGSTASDTRDIMIKGESGILACCPPWWMPVYEPSKRVVLFPNGVECKVYSAEEPERFRGPQHDGGWADEIASWKRGQETWDNIEFCMRLGENPRVVVTSTPKPKKLILDLQSAKDTHLTTGSTYDNAPNLSAKFIQTIRDKYEGTRLGRQEIKGETLTDTPGALWTLQGIDDDRVEEAPALKRICVALDPSGSSDPTADEAGIIACGLGEDDHGYVLEDGSLQGTPDKWAERTIDLHDVLKADLIVYEFNFGGEMAATILNLKRPGMRIKDVVASRGKYLRAEPVSALYEQHKVHHVGGNQGLIDGRHREFGKFEKLENEMTTWVPNQGQRSPNRLDALVFALTELMITGGTGFRGRVI